jgi:alpha-2-macroglobulin
MYFYSSVHLEIKATAIIMGKILFLTCVLFPLCIFCQVNLKDIRKSSHEVFAYKIDAALAEKFIKQDSIGIDAFVTDAPVAIFPADSVDQKKLLPGHYVLISAEDNRVIANLFSVSGLMVYPVNNQHRVQLLLINKNGDFINDAKIWVNGKEAAFSATSQSYQVKQKNPDEARIKVFTENDTLFSSLLAKDELDKTINEQRWNNFKKTWLVRTVVWLPGKIAKLFKEKNYYHSSSAGTAGMMIFNQPKYKQKDTVKFKAYVFNKKGKAFSKPVNVFLEYYADGRSSKVFLQKLLPSSAGSYIFQFPLSDTLKTDISYNVVFRNKDDKRLLSKNFRIEDYLLDEISSYNIRSVQDVYYAKDTMHFFASALNANGLSVLDGSVKLILTAENIYSFYPGSLSVPDTLYTAEKQLLTNGETKFDFPADKLPDADLNINATIEFKNGNNELQEKNIEVSYKAAHKEFKAFVENDSVFAINRENGKVVSAQGFIYVHNGRNEKKEIQYPYKIKIEPFATDYDFYLLQDGKIKDSSTIKIENDYTISLKRISHGDTLGFILNNPFSIPVSFTAFDGNKITGAGKSSDPQIHWSIIAPDKKHLYRVSWQYYWAGEEKIKEQSIALLYKLLNIEVKSSSTIFPGQRDTVSVIVKDYKNNPASGVNLTAVSYNNQFNKDIRVPDPPYLVSYKMRPSIKRDRYEEGDGYILKKYSLGKHTGWIKKLGLDSMLFYKMLFPLNGMLDAVSPISDFLPQLSVHATQNGERQEIYLLYINRTLVYYNGVTEKMKDAYQTDASYSQIGIRLQDKYIEIDSIYMQPFYKHDLFFDINNLPAHSRVTAMNDSLSENEKALLEKSTWIGDNNYIINNGFLWQQEKFVQLSGNHKHLVGPFREMDSLHFFSPSIFDIHFLFEPGYQYNLSKQILRLEKKKIFSEDKNKIKLTTVKSPEWILGDTIIAPPVINYPEKITHYQSYLRLSRYNDYRTNANGNGKFYFTTPRDTVLKYIILFQADSPQASLILPGDLRLIRNINPGEYSLLLIDKNWNTAESDDVFITANHTLCLHTEGLIYLKENNLVTQLANETISPEIKEQKQVNIPSHVDEKVADYEKGKSGITGKVIDKTGGHAIAGASIYIKGSGTGTSTKSDGTFSINNIKPGKCILIIASVGYAQKQVVAEVPADGFVNINISLAISTQHLDEVVVIGYGTTSKREMTASITKINGEELTQVNANGSKMLMGKVAGLQINNEGEPGGSINIILRGMSSVSANNHPLYVVDGIMYDEMPANISQDMIVSAEILKGAESTAIYGSKAGNGVVIITTRTKTLRTIFRDYAFWKPEFFTDKNGEAKFSVEYPDNITGWQTYILAMDKKRRIGKSVNFVTSYKPLMAQVSEPQFLIAGDTASIIGKSFNYSNDTYLLKSTFHINGKPADGKDIIINSKESVIRSYTLITPSTDSLQTSFSVKTNSGFTDAEERKIPILQKGTLEAKGQFWVLDKDTTVTFNPSRGNESIECYAQNNTLDILLNEISNLKKYPYYCMEQTASKLRGLLMEKIIKEKLHQQFDDEKTINILKEKLQKAQLFSGGWSWWENGKENIFITNYIIHALLSLRTEPMIETNIRNGLLYLQNQLPYLSKDELLYSLLTMSEAKHLMNYETWYKKIYFDSLTVNQQWQFIKMKQLQNADYSNELRKLMGKAIYSITGGMHWGEENYRWYSDADATTVVAFEVLQKEKNHEKELRAIVQYFLEQRSRGFWHNTVASASIVSAMLPYILSEYKEFNKPSLLQVNGDTSFVIKEFPFKIALKNNSANPISVQKTGGGITYLTFYQQSWNNTPEPVGDKFIIRSYFEKNGNETTNLNSGEKVKMMVNVNALKDADYVMIEIPIPAGCTHASKEQDGWDAHKEFLKNKVIVFAERINKGMHHFEVNLETRYSGTYTLNPVKVSLMYFPPFYGRNDLKHVVIQTK